MLCPRASVVPAQALPHKDMLEKLASEKADGISDATFSPKYGSTSVYAVWPKDVVEVWQIQVTPIIMSGENV